MTTTTTLLYPSPSSASSSLHLCLSCVLSKIMKVSISIHSLIVAACLLATVPAIPLPPSIKYSYSMAGSALPPGAGETVSWNMAGTVTVRPTHIDITKLPGPPFIVKKVAGYAQSDSIWHDVMFEASLAYGCYTFTLQRTIRFHASPEYKFEQIFQDIYTIPDRTRHGCQDVSPGKRDITPARDVWGIIPISSIAIA
ncbi:uncharacterized protein L969DRAFT_92452 [Mixia osmundae IAM 14324]|uniref:Uncharacterized protein n=1 Tax=Mixia osmundae (strain CBS 9802 / IAM 14324 / JCM 22182 / KY 12970) TaxID=764103 RepID=G7DXH9_MIXOS|nr:uncharacterized protein L969DRAFT_92452 [Mixia osmundae IAM 14324]KEI41217.1 hypothetical protein L969DRAFT_92452 [Mixia osmundae IAM 14324]GAA95289.1 hypothetical protein E5Q_01945 [Mixia osmundae IAM 14324]